ncbi:hypothetical protein P3T36_004955 [Kitasatospora sp. MAP12-15]|uniref:hypothetical protein n=1 Tax=unclassified Kitasatospora TaxID=2633591 RepID=UPI0024760052|nr:hypothetical protein [Kitasatospora sp. MAP12-44]MDH6112068.1 hypothetical protein [Kitasatospora sp. MAP12-44]
MSAPDPAGDPTPEPEAVVEAVAEAAPAPIAEPAPEAVPELEAVPEPEAVPELEAVPEPEPEEAPEPASEPVARRLPRVAAVALATAGLLTITAASAAVTVVVGKPDHPRTVAAAPVTAGPSPSATPSAAPGLVVTPSPTLVPSPSSTLHGTLSGSTHGGDLRYFLIPIPDGGESYGSADGMALTMDDLTKEYSDSPDIKSILDSYGYQEGVYRQYRTADGSMEVSSRLLRFSSRENAKEFAASSTFSAGTSVSVDGDSEAKGFVFKPDQQAFPGHLIGVSYMGDVAYEVTVDVKGDPDKALLSDAMKRQRDRLSSAG